ncbi:unnamed protein product [Periconia digitata]|uniref:Developmental regulatory protein wetA n=1 Tax=Periconia digitata TaxID=1303443 RepID=A0A9W4XIL1_9PLEO|nr:unnamed protein product [Periconia digitata]
MAYLLPTHTDIPMRATADKEPSTIDLEQLFEQYVETDLFQQFSSDDATADQSSSDDLAHLFEIPTSNGSITLETSTLPNMEPSIHGTSWHKAGHRQEKQSLASPNLDFLSSSIYSESSGKACLSDSDLYNFDDIFELDHLQLGADSHNPQSATVPRIKRTSSLDRLNRQGVRKTSRKPASLSNINKMMRPSHYRTGLQEPWAKKMNAAPENFNIQMPPNAFGSSALASTIVKEKSGKGYLPRDTQSYAVALSSPLYGEATTTPEVQTSNYEFTPLSSPAIEIGSKLNGTEHPFQPSSDNMGSAYMSQHFSNAALSALQTPPPTQRLPTVLWDVDASSNIQFGDLTAGFSTEESAKNNTWWTTTATSVPPFPQPSPTSNGHDVYSSDRTHTSTSDNLEPNGLGDASVVSGLGITCDTASFTGLDGDLSSSTSMTTPSTNSNNHLVPAVDAASSYDFAHHLRSVYPAPPSPGIPIGTGPARPPSPSNSRSHSPRPLFTRRRHSQMPSSHHQSHHASNHTRRKSSTNSGSHRTASGSWASGVGAGSSAGSGSVGFVNFTPSDSRKILTGVAPSGSSKTKARREREAADKRRKLSQAALKAVIEAGGDVGRLEKEGLLALEG